MSDFESLLSHGLLLILDVIDFEQSYDNSYIRKRWVHHYLLVVIVAKFTSNAIHNILLPFCGVSENVGCSLQSYLNIYNLCSGHGIWRWRHEWNCILSLVLLWAFCQCMFFQQLRGANVKMEKAESVCIISENLRSAWCSLLHLVRSAFLMYLQCYCYI